MKNDRKRTIKIFKMEKLNNLFRKRKKNMRQENRKPTNNNRERKENKLQENKVI